MLENIKRKGKLKLKKSHNIRLKATYDEIKLSKELKVICRAINVDAVDDSFHVELSGEIKITKSKEGKKVDLSRLKENIYDMINKKKIENINLPVLTSYPKVSTEQVCSAKCEFPPVSQATVTIRKCLATYTAVILLLDQEA